MNIVKRKNKIAQKLSTMGATITLFLIKCNMCLAEDGIGTAEVKTATENIKRVITSVAMPLGGAIKMIVNANNPQKRSESIGSLAWICGGGVILGLSLIIAGIIVNVATNNTNSLIGS